MDNFDLAELKGRNFFSGFCITQTDIIFNKFSTTKYATYDASYWSGGTKVIAEIKFRNEPSTKYGNWYLQERKYKSLQRLKKIIDTRPPTDDKPCVIQYINLYTDGVIEIWDITDLSHKLPVETVCKKTTYGDTTPVKKMQYLLNNKDTILKARYE